LYAWVVVFILPVNSAVNPLLYTFTTPKYRGQLFKFGWPQESQKGLVTRRQSTAGYDSSISLDTV
jgi:leucine-rich repeat-containing G protein-coupled receptor 8